MKLDMAIGILILGTLLSISGCGSSGDSTPKSDDNQITTEQESQTPIGSENQTVARDLIVQTRLSDTTGFLTAVDGSKAQEVTNINGVEINPSKGIFHYNGFVYTTGSMSDNKIEKYSVNSNGILKLEAENTVSESAVSIPTLYVFVNETKAYLLLAGTGELLVINPADLSILKRIDLAEYAMGEGDTNPEPSGGIIRDGILYLGLGQLDSFQTYRCRGEASMLIIDVSSDEIIKHITDDRTCSTGAIDPKSKFILDENNDLYINHTASFGYYPGYKAGYLKIKSGETEFDPDYFFSVNDVNLSVDGVAGDLASYAYHDAYINNGEVYTTLMIPGLTSNPPNYAEDKNYLPYKVDLYNQTLTKLDMLPTTGWSTPVINYNNQIIYGLTTDNGTGLYRLGEKVPYITTEGNPTGMVVY